MEEDVEDLSKEWREEYKLSGNRKKQPVVAKPNESQIAYMKSFENKYGEVEEENKYNDRALPRRQNNDDEKSDIESKLSRR
jgi:hypothetical protein